MPKSSNKTSPADKNAVVLLSGGLDSTTVLAIARDEGFCCHCLSFSYGQRQAIELERAGENAKKMGAAHHLVLNLDLDKIGGSALTSGIDVPKGRSYEEMEADIPVTYVPCRNTIFLSYATAWGEVVGAHHIFIGVNALDYSGYPDCRPEFLRAFEQVANLGTKAGVSGAGHFTIHAPLMHLSKKEIIMKGTSLGVDYSTTHSCYDPNENGIACGSCDSCRLRLKGFSEAGLTDPISYQR
ncbi:MAG: 7-cyano-7-deazaguanine synthase QueC [Desulfobulbaceae bacterium]|nr:7-cyano-7-deazaguanine synthase QueC [Desulfobulbaceae bacterium]